MRSMHATASAQIISQILFVCAEHWPEFEMIIDIVEDRRMEQAILEAAERKGK